MRPICFALLLLLAAKPAVSSEPAASLMDYQQHALTHAGDPIKGERIFANRESAKCATCHTADGQGGKVGPDLSGIGGKFDRPHLIESLLEPSRQIVEGYRSSMVLTMDGRVITGIIKQQDDKRLLVEDASATRIEVLRDDIQQIQTSPVSIMPDGLADSLSKKDFTDLIAYLEQRRVGSPENFGAGVNGPIRIPDGYQIDTIATGISGATAMEVLNDGRILICEQPGDLRVIKDGRLLPKPMLSVDTELNWERGLIGVTVHPRFPQQPYVYVCYVVNNPYTHHRVSRFKVDGDVADLSSEEVLLRGDDQSQLGGHVPAGHQGGALHFGTDGKLYIGLGEQTAGLPAQSLTTLQGKILRINDDGSVPRDNPFVSQTTGKYQAIWAIGCRNPFTFAVNQTDGQMLINDVGGKFEEINVGLSGANYGWPVVEHGMTDKEGFVGPIHVYPESSISGGDFAPSAFSGESAGHYFFADFVRGWIHSIDPTDGSRAEGFASGLRRAVDLRFASDGSMYVLLRNAWVVDDKFERGTGSLLRISQR